MSRIIISKAPFRISLAGGGTDIFSWCSKYGGQVIGFSIDRYVITTLLPRNFQSHNEVSLENSEIFTEVSEINNEYLSLAIQKSAIRNNFKMSILSDAPSKSGLGGSAAFLNSIIYAFKNNEQTPITKCALAELSSSIEIDDLMRPVGKQDHYLSSLGGVNLLTFDRDNHVDIKKIELKEKCLNYFNGNMMLFFTNIRRSAGKVLMRQSDQINHYDSATIHIMNEIKELVKPMHDAITSDNPYDIGRILKEHWKLKKMLSKNDADEMISQLMDICYKNGADGFKILGAGGGGFILVSAAEEYKSKIKSELRKFNIHELEFKVDFSGTTADVISI